MWIVDKLKQAGLYTVIIMAYLVAVMVLLGLAIIALTTKG